MSGIDDLRARAEAERQRASDAYDEVENDLAGAKELLEQLEQEDLDSPKRSASRENKMRIVEDEIEGLRQDLADAEDDLTRAISFWDEVNG
ncbi:hypothetical protein QQX10_10715 [Demequina sp. SYSU T00039]|uniref:Uncharacterized protein n=1 Tax=Demequina lignilytica TaxID=3051663 RepID=A0AAW7M433_9MICO|nr:MULTISPECIES: hypothetical protein [unclassified Demequina]MDN4478661.1 hypothetical protein [Demequina sp. SYSU T00039-1]MDN4488639.1 hypothetical protein [Demequina sp. SYSU T00039]